MEFKIPIKSVCSYLKQKSCFYEVHRLPVSLSNFKLVYTNQITFRRRLIAAERGL